MERPRRWQEGRWHQASAHAAVQAEAGTGGRMECSSQAESERRQREATKERVVEAWCWQ